IGRSLPLGGQLPASGVPDLDAAVPPTDEQELTIAGRRQAGHGLGEPAQCGGYPVRRVPANQRVDFLPTPDEPAPVRGVKEVIRTLPVERQLADDREVTGPEGPDDARPATRAGNFGCTRTKSCASGRPARERLGEQAPAGPHQADPST